MASAGILPADVGFQDADDTASPRPFQPEWLFISESKIPKAKAFGISFYDFFSGAAGRTVMRTLEAP